MLNKSLSERSMSLLFLLACPFLQICGMMISDLLINVAFMLMSGGRKPTVSLVNTLLSFPWVKLASTLLWTFFGENEPRKVHLICIRIFSQLQSLYFPV